MRVAFLGLGIMGSRMAANLTRAGHELTVWNRTTSVADEFAALHPGVKVAASPREAGISAEVVLTMVVDGRQVHELLLGPEGAATAAAAGTLFIDGSTTGPAYARSIATSLQDMKMRFLDAPVTGSSPRAEAGTLVFMVGGERADFDAALPLLETMGSQIVYAGLSGQGQVVKVINNAVAATNAAVVGGALLAAKRMGADLDALVEVMAAGSGGSTMLELKAAPMRAHDYTPLFKLDHMLKDVRLCLEAGRAAGAQFRFVPETEAILAQASVMGHGDDDFAALIEGLEAASDLRL